MTLAEQNKALVRRFYEEIDKGNIGVLDDCREARRRSSWGSEDRERSQDDLDHDPPSCEWQTGREVVGKRRDGILGGTPSPLAYFTSKRN
jgi:hypothetical protein